MRKMLISLSLLILVFSFEAQSSDKYISKYVPNSKLVGSANMSFLIWDVYDINLYAEGASYNKSKPFALELKYKISATGEEIAKKSYSEIKKLGYKNRKNLKEWKSRMIDIFPDVEEGSTITGISKNGNSIFYYNGKKVGVIEDKEFTENFFDIWLSKRTSEPRIRKKLMGEL